MGATTALGTLFIGSRMAGVAMAAACWTSDSVANTARVIELQSADRYNSALRRRPLRGAKLAGDLAPFDV